MVHDARMHVVVLSRNLLSLQRQSAVIPVEEQLESGRAATKQVRWLAGGESVVTTSRMVEG